MKKSEQIINAITDSIILKTGGCVLHNDNTLSKVIEGKVIRKQCVAKKDWSHDWIENVKIEDIDTRYYNLDYSKK